MVFHGVHPCPAQSDWEHSFYSWKLVQSPLSKLRDTGHGATLWSSAGLVIKPQVLIMGAVGPFSGSAADLLHNLISCVWSSPIMTWNVLLSYKNCYFRTSNKYALVDRVASVLGKPGRKANPGKVRGRQGWELLCFWWVRVELVAANEMSSEKSSFWLSPHLYTPPHLYRWPGGWRENTVV